MYDFYGECVRRGYTLSDEPIFNIQERQDFLSGRIDGTPSPYYVCVPVKLGKTDAQTLPECRALSVLYCGGYSSVDEMWLTMGREVKALGLTPAGLSRVLCIVTPYTGREIETKRYCSRLVLPAKD